MAEIINREEKGSFEFAANLQVKKGAALDPRTVVEKYEDLKNLGTWPYDASERKENGQVVKDDNGDIVYDYIIYLYKGLAVSVTEENCIYILKDPDNFDQDSAWEKVGGGDGKSVFLSDSFEESTYPEETGFGEFTSIEKGESLDSSTSKLEKNLITLVEEVIDNERTVSNSLIDLNFRTNKLFTKKADKADTLEGYGITDAYISETGVITLGNRSISPITSETQLKNKYLTLQKNGKTIAIYDGSNSVTANISFTPEELGLSTALKYCGISQTVLEDGSTINPILINNNYHQATSGCVVFYKDKEFIFNGTEWEEFGYPIDLSLYKTKQSTVATPASNGNSTSFIDSIFQDQNGVITITKKNISPASLSTKGIVQLSSEIDSESQAYAATSKAVKDVYDLVNNKLDKNALDNLSAGSVYFTDKFSPTSYPQDTGNGKFTDLNTEDSIESAISKIDGNLVELVNKTLDNEVIIAAALTELNNRIAEKEILSDDPQPQNLSLGGNPVYKKVISLEYLTPGEEDTWEIPCSNDMMGVTLIDMSCILTQIYDTDGAISFDYRDNAAFNKNSNNLVYFYKHNSGKLIIRFTSNVETKIFATITFSTSAVISGGDGTTIVNEDIIDGGSCI